MTFDMEKARALSERARAFKVYTVPGQTGYGVDHSKYPEYHAVKEICQTAFPCALDRISELENEAQEYHDRKEDFAAALTRANKRITALNAAAKADESRLIAAAAKARITYFGCDTPDHLADRVLELESALIEERAKTALANHPIQTGWADRDKHEAARQQLHSEGKI